MVIGTHGRTGLELTLPGSTTERIVPIVGVPVLLVHLDPSQEPGYPERDGASDGDTERVADVPESGFLPAEQATVVLSESCPGV
ncbi:MAG: universal stress protein [Haloarculaceae archaeon]